MRIIRCAASRDPGAADSLIERRFVGFRLARRSMLLEFRLLGGVEILASGQSVRVGPAKLQCVLAILLVDAGQVVPAAALVDRIWDNDPPGGPLNVVYAYI